MRAHNFLVENSILLEYDRSKTAQAYGTKLLAVAAKDTWLTNQILRRMKHLEGLSFSKIAEREPALVIDYILRILEQGDPTPHKEYAQSIAKLYSNGQSRAEDIVSTLADYLTKFDKLKRRKKIQPPRNDFNRYRNLEDFFDVVDEYPDEEAEPQTKEYNVKELYRDPSLIVTIPLDVEAACYVGRGTRWCTAAKNNNMYKHYTGNNNAKPLYAIIPRQPAYPGEKYQFHFETKQFMNEQDHPIGDEGMTELVKRFPVLTKILQGPAEKFGIGPLIGPEYHQIVQEATPEIKKQIAELIMQYQDRIFQFGMKSLTEYGITLPEPAVQALHQEFPDYLKQCVKALVSDSVWGGLLAQPGNERSQDKIETILNANTTLTKITKGNPIYNSLAEAIQQSGKRVSADAIKYVADIVLRDPLFRICMTKISQLYTAALREKGHALD